MANSSTKQRNHDINKYDYSNDDTQHQQDYGQWILIAGGRSLPTWIKASDKNRKDDQYKQKAQSKPTKTNDNSNQEESRNRVLKDLDIMKKYCEENDGLYGCRSYYVVNESVKDDLSRWQILNTIRKCARKHAGGYHNKMNIYYSGY